jgi:hypothetical protein
MSQDGFGNSPDLESKNKNAAARDVRVLPTIRNFENLPSTLKPPTCQLQVWNFQKFSLFTVFQAF